MFQDQAYINYDLPELKISQTEPRHQLSRLKKLEGTLKKEQYFEDGLFDTQSQGSRHSRRTQIKLEEQRTLPQAISKEDVLLNQSPIAPLRFSVVQKSIEVLKRAIPGIVDNFLVEKMYTALFNNFNSAKNIQLRVQPKEKAGFRASSKKQKVLKHHHSNKAGLNKEKGQKPEDQLLYEQKMRLFKKHEEMKTLEKEAKLAKKEQKKTKKLAAKKQLKQVWNDQLQADFIELYKLHQQFHLIKKYLTLKYPQYKDYFSYNQLRYQAYKIFRLAIRKLNYVITNFKEAKLPDLLKITEIRYNFIFYYREGAKVRFMLTELYRLQELNRDLLCKLIISINNLCIDLEQDKELLSRIGRKGGRRRDRDSEAAGRYQLRDQEFSERRDLYETCSNPEEDQLAFYGDQ